MRDKIVALDLSAVLQRLIKIDRWKEKHASEAIEQYRRFLFLKWKYGKDYVLPPSYEIDEVWHAHVLHTKDYMYFCQNVFGEYLHHHPHLTQEATNLNELEKHFRKTQSFYMQEFNQPIYAILPAEPFRSLQKMSVHFKYWMRIKFSEFFNKRVKTTL